LIWQSKLFGDLTVSGSELNLKREEIIEDYQLWWPRGQGDQYLYKDEWLIKDQKGNLLFKQNISFGIKHAELINQPDKWGTSYEIKVNGRPIFCKGADYIPQDVFPSRVKEEDLRKMVETMAESNFNMVRVWGGGYYPDDAFFDALSFTIPSQTVTLNVAAECKIMDWRDVSNSPTIAGTNSCNICIEGYFCLASSSLPTTAVSESTREGLIKL
jgi:hypothetical protein